MKATTTILLVFLIASTFAYAPLANGQSPTPSNTLVVCVGAHPDDIDIGVSGILYKNYIGKNPILWIVVTDGGADIDEYYYESNSSRNWIEADGKTVSAWKAPDGSKIIRPFYSADMAKKRCGGYFEGLNWIEAPASHDSIFGVEYDWQTRINSIDATIETIQLGYVDPSDPAKRLAYPDGALSTAEASYTDSIAANLASEIAGVVEANGYQKNLLKIFSHGIDEVCTNANEHSDHKVAGKAVRQAINLLHENYGFDQIDATWFTIYSPINPQPDYSRVDVDISQQETQKVALAKAYWETEAVNNTGINYTWVDFPEDPGQHEYTITKSYSAPSSIAKFINWLAAIFNTIVHQYPFALLVVVIVVIVVIAVAGRKRKK